MTNLKWKAVLIVATVLICAYGIVGIPKSKEELVANWNQNIRLGLDLKGGSLLVLQVQEQDAFKSEANTLIERLKEEMGKQGIAYSSFDHTDPQTLAEADTIQIHVKGVPADKTQAFRALAADVAASWVLTPVNSTDYALKMKPTEALQLKEDTVERAMTTIESRINGLGLAESSVQRRGGAGSEAEILISLPGLDDPARVKSILQTAALLELYEVKDGPFPKMEDALAKNGGVLPLNTKLMRSQARAGDQGNEGWYLVARTPVITGRDLRDAKPAQDEFGNGRRRLCCRRTPRGGSGGSRKQTWATGWRLRWTARFAALQPFRAGLRIRAGSRAHRRSRMRATWRWCCAPARCRRA